MDLYHAALWWDGGFALACAIILATIILWQRTRGSSLRALGWGKPAPWPALAVGVCLGIAFTASIYMGARRSLPDYDATEFSWVRVALAPVGIFLAATEELMMRGFFMTELQRARVWTWLQIVASGACTAVYHAIHNPTPLGFFPSFFLFSVFAALYVFSKRSLTPPIIAHASMHVFGDPYLLMMALAAMKA
jgi:membrane protease YdiL (CAAX protease family)